MRDVWRNEMAVVPVYCPWCEQRMPRCGEHGDRELERHCREQHGRRLGRPAQFIREGVPMPSGRDDDDL